MERAFLTAEYDEPKADSTFKGFMVSDMDDSKRTKKIMFNTGDPIYDYYAYKRWMMNSRVFMVTHSSSVDHFFMDSKKYIERHVVFNEDYTEGVLVHWQDAEKLGHNVDSLPTVMATKKHKKFSEIKNYCKEKEAKENIIVRKDFTIKLSKK